jgi:hypothetical protein
MEQDLQVGLEVRPPVVVEKNHPKKTGGGKWCRGILSPFQISWKTKKRSTKPSTSTRKSLLIFGGQWFENGDKLRLRQFCSAS